MPLASALVCFKVDDVEPSPEFPRCGGGRLGEPPADEASPAAARKNLALEACCPSDGRLISHRCPRVVEAVHLLTPVTRRSSFHPIMCGW